MFNSTASPTGANQKTVEAAGTVYSLTNAQAAVTFGTTSPSITLDQAGTYLIMASANLKYNGATFAASRTATMKLRRTNNTAADLTGATRDTVTAVVTTLTDTLMHVSVMAIYTTALANDIISLFGGLDVAPSAGSLDVTQASLIAIRLTP